MQGVATWWVCGHHGRGHESRRIFLRRVSKGFAQDSGRIEWVSDIEFSFGHMNGHQIWFHSVVASGMSSSHPRSFAVVVTEAALVSVPYSANTDAVQPTQALQSVLSGALANFSRAMVLTTPQSAFLDLPPSRAGVVARAVLPSLLTRYLPSI